MLLLLFFQLLGDELFKIRCSLLRAQSLCRCYGFRKCLALRSIILTALTARSIHLLLPTATHEPVHIDGLRVELGEARFTVGDAEAIAALEAEAAPDRGPTTLASLPTASAVAETLPTGSYALTACQDPPAVESLPARATHVPQTPTHQTY